MAKTSILGGSFIRTAIAACALLASCGGGGGGSGPSSTLVSIELTKSTLSIAVGTTQSLVATGKFSDVTTRDVSDLVVWSSADPAVIAVSNQDGSRGLASGLAQGSTTISARLAGITGSATFTVTGAALVAIEVTPTQPHIALGTSRTFVATGRLSDMTTLDVSDQVAWVSSDPAVSAVSNLPGSKGVASGLAPGSTTISASLSGLSGSTLLSVTAAALVSIEVTPVDPGIALGTTQQLAATGLFSDSTTQDLGAQCVWSTSDALVADVSNAAGSHGLATGIAAGSASISAALLGVTGSTTLTVTNAALVSIDVAPANPSIASGTAQQLTATGTFSDVSTQDLTSQVAWASADLAVATVSNAGASRGLAHGVGAGSTLVSATLAGVSGATTMTVTNAALVSIAVTPTAPAIALGTEQQLVATGTYSDGTTQDLTALVTWTSGIGAVAPVSNAAGSHGLATSVGIGSTLVAATLAGVSGSTTLTVSGAALVAIDVTPTGPALALGTARQLLATGTYTDGSTQDLTGQATWTTSDVGVARISNAAGSEGLVVGVGVGSTLVTATLSGVGGSTLIAVSNAALVSIDVTPADPSLALGLTQRLVATGTYTDSSTQDISTQVTWASANGAVIAVSNAAGSEGQATGVGVGSTDVSAKLAGIVGSTTLSVTNAVLASIEVDPADATVALGTAQQFSAVGIYSDGSAQELTSQVTWESANGTVAAISNAAGSPGLATSLGTGGTTISASFSGVSGSTPFTVSNAALVALEVAPFQPSIAAGTRTQFTATGLFTDGSTQELTTQVTWASSDILVAVISNAPGTSGLSTGVGVGSTTISAGLDGVSGTTTLSVTSAFLVSLDLAPAVSQIPDGMTQQFVAIGTYSDSSTQDLTAQVTWGSSDGAVTVISNADGSRGLATGTGVGSATISASFSGITGSATLSVTNAVLVSISVTAAAPAVPVGYKSALAATGNYSDGSTYDLTAQAVWASSASAVAAVSNAAGSKGVATGLSVGVTTISAAFGGIAGSAVLTVDNEKLMSIQVAPAPVDLDVGDQRQLHALGTFSGGLVLDITVQVNWSSNRKSVASVGNSTTKGLVSAKTAGTATIKAKKANKSGTATVNVP